MKDWFGALAGFTMIELVVVMGVIVLLTSIGAAGYNGFNDTQKLKQTGLTLKNNLRVAQTKAIAASKPSSGCTTLMGYVATFTANGYAINPQCTDGVIDDPTTVTFSAGVTFSPVPSSFFFTTLTGRISVSTDRTLMLIGLSKKYTLIVHPNGDIDDSGLAAL